MEDDFSVLRKFTNKEQALELLEVLEENQVECLISDNIQPVDVTFSGSTLTHEFEIRIKKDAFLKAERILEQHAEKAIRQINEDYYLFEFSDDELYEVLLKKDEWSDFDYLLAKKILKERGQPIEEDKLESLQRERLLKLAQPESPQTTLIIFGYLFSILGGLIGLIIGYILWNSKKSLPNGEKTYSYSEHDRKHGKLIFYISMMVTPISLLLNVVRNY